MEILEVGPRDGLQNERSIISVQEKLALIRKALGSGIKRIEVASFVNPKKVPQMAGAEALIAQLPNPSPAIYVGLVLNIRGLERALSTSIQEVGAVVVATDTFARKNQGQTLQQSIDVARTIIETAKQDGRRTNVTIAAAFGCPFEGEVCQERILKIAAQLAEAGPDQIAIADTIGVADPWRVSSLVRALKDSLPHMSLRAHFHNTRNTGLANAYAAAKEGVDTLDASIGGIGGCPFAPAATGNIATEDLVYMLERGGHRTEIELAELLATSHWLSGALNRELPAMVSKAGLFPKVQSAA